MKTVALHVAVIVAASWFSTLKAADELAKAERTLAKADKELAAEVARLLAAGKQPEAARVQKMLQAIADVAPQDKTKDGAKARARMLAVSIVGVWDRHQSPDKYVFSQDGTAISKGATGQENNRGAIRVVTPEYAELRWNSGHIWTMFPVAGASRIAIEEKHGGDFVNDGIVLFRTQ